MSGQPAVKSVIDNRPRILVIDDSPEILGIVNDLLKQDYRLSAANGGQRGLSLASAAPRPDLILLDIMMPDVNGLDVCRQLKASAITRDIPVVFLTAMDNEADEQLGFELGAVDYISKPISGPILRSRVKLHLSIKQHTDLIQDNNTFLANEVAKRTREIEMVQDVTIFVMTSLAETRDNETGNHIRRTQFFVKLLAEHLRNHPRFSAELTTANIELIFKSAPLHDIGKVGIPDHILLKPGKLTAEEFEIMKTHTTIGKEAIEHAESQGGRSVPFLAYAKEIAYGHQEKWDGSGYPRGLAGDMIHISARLMAVADVYDALISTRPYKVGMPHSKAKEILVNGRGTHFDPDIIDAFLALENDFIDIAERFRDELPLAQSAEE
jgi:putative two-component system response regulator